MARIPGTRYTPHKTEKLERNSVNGPVRTYFLSAEELEKYRAIPPPEQTPYAFGTFKRSPRGG